MVSEGDGRPGAPGGGAPIDAGEGPALRRAEEARAAAEGRLRELADAMFEGLTIHEEGRILFVNQAFCQMFGYPPGELIGKSVLDLAAPESRALVARNATAGLEGTYEALGLRRDGSTFVGLLHGKHGTFAGRPVRITAVRDISELKRAQEALQQSEARLRRIIEGAPDAIVVHRLGRFVYANPAALTLIGQSRVEDVVGRPVIEIIHPDDRDMVRERLRRQAVTGEPMPPQLERVVRPDGSVILAEIASLTIDFDGEPASLVFGRDVTRRLQAEAERDRLLEQERAARAAAERTAQRAALLADASRHLAGSFDVGATLAAVARLLAVRVGGLCLIDLAVVDGRLERIAAEHADPARGEDLAALRRARLDPFAAEGPPRAVRQGQTLIYDQIAPEALRPGTSPAGTDDPEHLALLRRFGVRRLTAVPLVARGRTLGVLTSACCDATHSHGDDDVALIEDVAHRVALAVDNAQLHEATERAVKLRDDFLSIASHELKTPLTSLTLAVQGLERVLRGGRAAELPAEMAVRALEIAGRQTTRLGQLVGALLDVTRIQAGRLSLTLEPVNLAALLHEVTTRMANDLQASGCTLTVTCAPDLVGQWDRSRLDQVVTNLLANAIKFGAGAPVAIGVTADAGTVRLEVRDRGIGVSHDARERIFRRFERAVSSEHYGGMGLGLYIVRRIVEAHGGSIAVDSEPGAGAVFAVTLPRSAPAPAAGRP